MADASVGGVHLGNSSTRSAAAWRMYFLSPRLACLPSLRLTACSAVRPAIPELGECMTHDHGHERQSPPTGYGSRRGDVRIRSGRDDAPAGCYRRAAPPWGPAALQQGLTVKQATPQAPRAGQAPVAAAVIRDVRQTLTCPPRGHVRELSQAAAHSWQCTMFS